jgi:hypothetical protein
LLRQGRKSFSISVKKVIIKSNIITLSEGENVTRIGILTYTQRLLRSFNAIADDGFVNDAVTGNSHNLWFWDLFFITDYLIMAAALYWYNKFHVSSILKKSNNIEL